MKNNFYTYPSQKNPVYSHSVQTVPVASKRMQELTDVPNLTESFSKPAQGNTEMNRLTRTEDSLILHHRRWAFFQQLKNDLPSSMPFSKKR